MGDPFMESIRSFILWHLIEVAYLYILFTDNEPSFCLFNLVLSKIIIISQDTLLGLFLIFSVTSLFAAQAGASRVIAVEASEKMASVATQVTFLILLLFRPSLYFIY